MRTQVIMRLNAIGCILWVVFADFSIVTSRTLGSDDSCPCVTSDECSDKSWMFFNNNQVMILPCENENLIRCCSMVVRSIESTNTSESMSLEEPKNEVDSAISAQFQEIVEENATSMLQTDVPFLEESTWDIPVNESESLNDMDTVTIESENITYTDPTENHIEVTQSRRDDPIIKDVNQVPLQHPVKEFLSEPRSKHAKILTNMVTNASSISNFGTSGNMVRENLKPKKTMPVLLPQNDEEDPHVLDLIHRVRTFESRRTVPRQRDLLFDPVEEIKSAPTDTVVLNNGYFNVKLGVPPEAKRLPEKMSDLLEQKTSLKEALTLDGVSVQATNENASPLSELDVAEHDDTSNENLSHPEDVQDIKRVARSHASESNEEIPRISSSITETASQTEADSASMKHFRRPPRVLPFRNLPNEEHGSNKFANSKERARSLFNKSNEKRRKHVSLFINRNDSNPKILNSMTTENIENESSSSKKNMDLVVEESVRM